MESVVAVSSVGKAVRKMLRTSGKTFLWKFPLNKRIFFVETDALVVI